MEFITENGEEYILVSTQTHLDEIGDRIVKQQPFAHQFKFSDGELFLKLLESVQVNYEDFTKKYLHYDAVRKLHISQSEFGHIWISNMGLVPNKKSAKNRAVNACLNQHTVISLLLEKAIEVVKDDKVYDIDSYSFGFLSKLSPAIYHNLVFYIEVFCKAYLSLTGIKPRPRPTHKLSSIYQETVDVMNSYHHDDSLFQVLVLEPLCKFVEHLNKIPGDFKEQFIKYDDNLQDDTVVIFDLAALREIKNLLELSNDFINEYLYDGVDTHYLKSNLYQRMLEKVETEEKKKMIKDLYPHLDKGNNSIAVGAERNMDAIII